jgi:competence protein ComEA
VAIRDRLDGLSRGELAGLGVLTALLVAGAAVWYVRSLPQPVAIQASGSGGGPPAASASPSAPAIVIVDVAGAVRRPGVYDFSPGERVVDAIERAGGPTARADLTVLNLAAPLVDGTQILVPKRGAPSTSGAAPGSSGSTGTSGTAGSVVGGLINVNTADAATLETLNGIGEVLAAAIVSYREEHGPFTSVDQLEDVSGIGPATLEKIRDQVTV